MLIVDNCIVSEDVAEKCFSCPLDECKGACCIEGDAGAPLADEEIPLLTELLPTLQPYMTEEGYRAVLEHGVNTPDCEGEACTTLVNGKECAFVTWQDGKALCAIEKAWRDGKVDFMKPISCHLYPLRLTDYDDFIAINYHRWEVCDCALAAGKKCGVPLYKYLREPLVRRFGEAWYEELVEACEDYFARRDGKKK